MDGVRDMALAAYENLSDEEKVRIHNNFKQAIVDGNFSKCLYSHSVSAPEFVDKCLEAYKGYTKGSFDFNGFITLRYVHSVVMPLKTLKVTTTQNSTIVEICLDKSNEMYYTDKANREGMSDFINGVMIDLAGDLVGITTSIKTEGWKKLNRRVSKPDKKAKLGEISRHLPQLKLHANEIPSKHVEEDGHDENIRANDTDEEDDSNNYKNWSSSWRVSKDLSDLLGAKASAWRTD